MKKMGLVMLSTLVHTVLIIINLIIEINTSIIFGFSLTEVNLGKVLRKSIFISSIVGILFYYFTTFTKNDFSLLWIFLIIIPFIFFYMRLSLSQVIVIVLTALAFNLCIIKILEYNLLNILLVRSNIVDDPIIQSFVTIFQSLSNIVITMLIFNTRIVFFPNFLFEDKLLYKNSIDDCYNTNIYSIEFILFTLNLGLYIMFLELDYFRLSFRIILIFLSIIISSTLLFYLKSNIKYKSKIRDILYDSQHQQEILSYYNVIRSQRHDFNFHLNAIYSLINNKSYFECKEYIEDIVKDARYINELLPLYHPVIGAMLNTFKEIAMQKGIQINYFIYDNLKSMPCSVYEMNKILGNLIQNAIDELEEKNHNNPKIDVDISKERGSIVVKVTNVTDLENDQLENIFNVGYSTKSLHEGLGLPMVKRILLKYNGIIYPEILDEEISFIVRIPIL